MESNWNKMSIQRRKYVFQPLISIFPRQYIEKHLIFHDYKFVCFYSHPIWNFFQWAFRNSLFCSFKQTKSSTLLKIIFTILFCTALISYQCLDFCLACSLHAPCLQLAQDVQSSLIGCSGHIESIKKYLWWIKQT